MEMLRYTIKALVDIPAESPDGISEILDHIKESGAAVIANVEPVEAEQELPDDDSIKAL